MLDRKLSAVLFNFDFFCKINNSSAVECGVVVVVELPSLVLFIIESGLLSAGGGGDGDAPSLLDIVFTEFCSTKT